MFSLRSLFIFSALFAASANAFLGFDEEEMTFFKERAPQELQSALGDLTTDDKIIIYQRAVNGELFTAKTLLGENERIVKLVSVLVNEVGKKIARLDGNSKVFVLETLHSAFGLMQELSAGKDADFAELAKKEEIRFRSLNYEEQLAVQEQFPILTEIGVFTNGKFKNLAAGLAKETQKMHTEL